MEIYVFVTEKCVCMQTHNVCQHINQWVPGGLKDKGCCVYVRAVVVVRYNW